MTSLLQNGSGRLSARAGQGCPGCSENDFPSIAAEGRLRKEQARKYARSQNCRFVILSNGNLHYFWDLERGNPYVITSFPTPTSVIGYQKVTPNPLRLIEDQVGADYIVRTQRPNYEAEAGWRNEAERPAYKTSKARICVTVGMMTTGYDCTDILNLGLFRPIFSPTDFIQIKGRGTRKHDFREQLFDDTRKEAVPQPRKTAFKLFDFFANCEYFEEDFNYDEVLKFPPSRSQGGDENGGGQGPVVTGGAYEHLGADILAMVKEATIGQEGMKIDRMFFEKFEDVIRANNTVATAVEAGQWDRVIDYINHEVFDKPEEFYTLDKLRKAAAVDRRITLREILEKVFGLIPRFKSKDELLEEEFAKFVADRVPEPPSAIPAIKTYFKAYVTSNRVRDIIDSKQFTDLATNPVFSTRDFRAVPEKYRALVPEYVKDYVSLNQFAA